MDTGYVYHVCIPTGRHPAYDVRYCRRSCAAGRTGRGRGGFNVSVTNENGDGCTALPVGQQLGRQVSVLVERDEGPTAAAHDDLGDRGVDDDRGDALVRRGRLEQVRDDDGDRAAGRD